MKAWLTACLVMSAGAAGCIQTGPDSAGPPLPASLLPWADAAFDTTGPFSRVLEPGALAVLPDEVVDLPSDVDGANIQIGVVRPDVPNGARVPVIAMSTVYYRDLDEGPLVDACRNTLSGPESGGPCSFDVRFLVENFVPHGYAVVLVAVRGTAGSGGCLDWAGPLETADVNQALTWAATQTWANGDVGVIGFSYGGMVAWNVAATANPHVKTTVPLSAAAFFPDLVVRNGTTTVPPAYYFSWVPRFGFGAQQDRDEARAAESTCPEHARFAAALEALESDPYGDPLGYWAERDPRPGIAADYRGSILFAQGVPEATHPATAQPWLRSLRDGGLRVHEVWGQWDHFVPDGGPHSQSAPAPIGNPTVRWDWAELLLRWFDHELKGAATDVGPVVQVADQTGAWRAEAEWPPRDANVVALDLATFDAAATPPSTVGHSTLGARGAAWSTTFAEATRIAGPVRATFDVTPGGPGGELGFEIRDTTDDVRLGWGALDLRYRDGETAQAVTPGARVTVTVEAVPLDVFVPARHTVTLFVDLSVPAAEPGPAGATPSVLHQEGAVTFPVIARDATTFLAPPTGPPTAP